jgi:hypothetical protein
MAHLLRIDETAVDVFKASSSTSCQRQDVELHSIHSNYQMNFKAN